MHEQENNRVELAGTVHGATWTSYNRHQRGRVNFWLAVDRDLAGDGFDLFQCAIEVQSGDELKRLDRELTDGRQLRLAAIARSQVNIDASLNAQKCVVIFLAEGCCMDGAQDLRSAHRIGAAPKHHAHGKAAAANDDLALFGQAPEA